MFRRLFTVIMILIPVLVIALSVQLLWVEKRLSQTIDAERHAIITLDAVSQARIILDQQRVRVATAVYIPLDVSEIEAWSADFQRLLSNPALVTTPDERRTIQQILAQERVFTRAAVALPRSLSRATVLSALNQAQDVATLLDEYNQTHRVNLSSLISTASQQRAVNTLLILIADAGVLILVLGGFLLLSRMSRLRSEAIALRDTEKLRSDFVSFAAHELRNPASAIEMAAAILRDPKITPEIYYATVDSINRSADALSRVVFNLLNIGRIEAGELRLQRQTIALPKLVEDLLAELEVYHPGLDRQVQRNLPDELVNVDIEYIKLALANLLDNAIKYSPPDSPIYLTGAVAGDKVIVHVRDTGSGIPAEMLPHIFEKYETSASAPQSERRGVGLGLYMARLLIEAHGGTVWAESVPGHGTTISFTLPRADGKTARPTHE